MNKREAVLAALASGGGGTFSPVQVQKLLFLIDEQLGDRLGGKIFKFEPYDYGPFDRAVYDTLRDLEVEGMVEITNNGRWSEYRLTASGQVSGRAVLKQLPTPVSDHIEKLSRWVRSLSFRELVLAIYKAYPAMREHSVFQE